MKVYHLSTCSTCRNILKRIAASGFQNMELQNIKTHPITRPQLEEMKQLAGSYEALFSKRSQKYRLMALHEKTLSEQDMNDLILQEYGFLKRPVILFNARIFIGSSEEQIQKLLKLLT